MLVNLFFSFGIMSTISACLNAKNNKNSILILEVCTGRDEEYYEIENLIIKMFESHFIKVIRIKSDHTLNNLNYRKPYSLLKQLAIYRERNEILKSELEEYLDHDYNVYAPLTSRLCGFYTKESKNNYLIEHGLGEYLLEKEPSQSKKVVSIIDGILGYKPIYRAYSRALLLGDMEFCDKKDINDFLFEFWDSFKMVNMSHYEKISTFFTEKNAVLIFLEPSEIRENLISNYLSHAKSNNVLYRAHPAMEVKSDSGFTFNDKLIKYIPTEFFSFFNDRCDIVFAGTISSSLFYAKKMFGSSIKLINLELDDLKSNINIDETRYKKVLNVINS